MTFDERIDRLTERHEALTQSLELLSKDVHELYTAVHELRMTADSHERRLTRLEGDEESE